MSRPNKGQDIGLDFGVAQSSAGVRILRLEEKSQDIAWCAGLVLGEQPTSFDGRVSWRLFRSSTGNISRNCFGSREISAGCCVISANGLILKTNPMGVHSAHSFALRSAGKA